MRSTHASATRANATRIRCFLEPMPTSFGGIPPPGNRVPSPPMYTQTFSQFKKQLCQLDKWLGTAVEYAKSKNFDPDVFVNLRLAPDQFPLARQVQIACDTVKLAAGFLTGKTMPAHEDNEKTILELQARVRSVIT